jgi:hypothetical protein
MSDDVGRATETAARETVRLPANLMSLVRQSYDSREKILDWCLAIGVVASLAWVFRDQIISVCSAEPGPNAGRRDAPQPNQDVANAFRPAKARADIYTYNMPPSRKIRYGIGPSSTRPPGNPSLPPTFEDDRP